jgi:segregation and condensation protein A
MSYLVEIPSFQGPMDLLLHLVRRNEMDIYDIQISLLTDQYLEYLAAMDVLDLEVAGEFIVMASTLLEIKSRMLLPAPPADDAEEEYEDPRAELSRRLAEYEAIKNASEHLRELEGQNLLCFARGIRLDAGEFPSDAPVFRNATADALMAALQRVLEAAAEEAEEPGPMLRQRFSVSLKMREITGLLQRHLEGVWFHETFPPRAPRMEIIVTFLAVLELLKRGRLLLEQRAPWEEIRLVGVKA